MSELKGLFCSMLLDAAIECVDDEDQKLSGKILKESIRSNDLVDELHYFADPSTVDRIPLADRKAAYDCLKKANSIMSDFLKDHKAPHDGAFGKK